MSIPTPPEGYRLIKPAFDRPGDPNDLLWNDHANPAKWIQRDFPNDPFFPETYYARRLTYDEAYQVGYSDGYATGYDHGSHHERSLAPKWRDAKTDPPKDDRRYLCQTTSGVDTSALGSLIRDRLRLSVVLRWLDYPDPPPVQSEEDKAFNNWFNDIGFTPDPEVLSKTRTAFEAGIAYARKEKP